MNAMHYGKIDDNGDVEFYLFLKPRKTPMKAVPIAIRG